MSRSRQSQDPPDGHVVVGRVIGPWGIRGDLRVQPQTDFPERFDPGTELHLDGSRITVVWSRPHRVGLVVRFREIADRTVAETLNGVLLTVPEDSLAKLPDDTYYHFQLIDLDVFTEEGEHLGQISEILTTPGNDVYVVRKPEQRDLLIPGIRDVVQDVDLEQGRMTVHLLPGLR